MSETQPPGLGNSPLVQAMVISLKVALIGLVLLGLAALGYAWYSGAFAAPAAEEPLGSLKAAAPAPLEKASATLPPSPTPEAPPTFTPTPRPPTLTPTRPPTNTRTPSPTPSDTPTPFIRRQLSSTPLPSPTSTLPAEALITAIRGDPQRLALDCEARAATTWAAFFGVAFDELDFAFALPRSDDPETGFVGDLNGNWGQIPPASYGVHAGPVAALLNQYGLKAEAMRNMSFDDLRREIAAGRPVIAWVVGHTGFGTPMPYTASNGATTTVAPYQHVVVVTGYDPLNVTILDGAETYQRPIVTFKISWGTLGNMAIRLVP